MQNTINSGCNKPQDITTLDTIIITPPPPPPPPPGDTVSIVRKLEVLSSLYPNYAINPFRTYSFTYDNLKRITSIGIKTYPAYTTDTFTTRLAYTGNNMRPTYIVMPYIDIFSPPAVDTTWFYYAADGKLLKDSCFERFLGGPLRKPSYRFYSYPNSSTAKIDWYWCANATASPSLLRRDTIKLNAGGQLDFIKAVYPTDTVTAVGPYAKAEGFTFSQIINPLSKLNISGTTYSLIYTDVKKELLGNSYHPLVYNSNSFAIYLDFISPYIPNIFYISGYNSLHQIMGQGGLAFPVEITPWTVRSNYPAEIKVKVSNSLAGDSYIYRYSY